jgi:hypothetical protein
MVWNMNLRKYYDIEHETSPLRLVPKASDTRRQESYTRADHAWDGIVKIPKEWMCPELWTVAIKEVEPNKPKPGYCRMPQEKRVNYCRTHQHGTSVQMNIIQY